jgi:5-formyltetrahydrofolate cyclo-ligase
VVAVVHDQFTGKPEVILKIPPEPTGSEIIFVAVLRSFLSQNKIPHRKQRGNSELMNDRQDIRKIIRLKRSQLSHHARLQASLEITHYISNTLWFRRSKRIAFYQAVRGELDPAHLMHCAWKMHKTCYLPICHPLHQSRLLFAPYFPDDLLQPNRYGILEPSIKKNTLCKPFALDLVFMPLLAFDANGNRLGSGKGYYDRTFGYLRRFKHSFKPLLVGLAYNFQEVEHLLAQPWDIPLDKIIVGTP